MTNKKMRIRNSTVEFLIFTTQASESGIEVRFQDETIWLSQKMMAVLFDCTTDNISLHLKNIFKTGELNVDSVTEDFSVTADDGKNYKTKHYNLDYAETQAERNIPMTMSDWAGKLNAFLQFNEKEILGNAGKVSQAIAKEFAESEFEKYRIVQDRLFESDFDKAIKMIEEPDIDNNKSSINSKE